MNNKTSNSNNRSSATSSIISNSNSNNVSRSTRSQCLKRKQAADDTIRWNSLYKDLLLSILEYCDQSILTQSLIHLNQYWSSIIQLTIVWNHRTIEFPLPISITEFHLFIRNHSYLINVNKWIWLRPLNYLYGDTIIHIPVLEYQSRLFNQLKSIKFYRLYLTETAIIVICTSFNSLNSLSLINCYTTRPALNLLYKEQFQYQLDSNNNSNNNNNNNSNSNSKPNRLISQLKTLDLNSLIIFDYPTGPIPLNCLFNLIQLESINVIKFKFNQSTNNNNNSNTLEFYSLIANRMPSLTYLNTDEGKITESTELQLIQFTAISQLIQQLKTCIIRKPYYQRSGIAGFNCSDWFNIFKLQSKSINSTSPLRHIKLEYSVELIDYLVQFPALTRLEIDSDYITNTDIKSLSALSALTELHLSPYELSPLIFTEFPSLTKLKILSIGNITDDHYTELKYSKFNELLIELLNCNSLIELYITILIERKVESIKKSTILTDLLELLSKFTKLQLLNISKLTLKYFKSESESNITTDSLWLNKFRIDLGKLLTNTVIQLAIDL